MIEEKIIKKINYLRKIVLCQTLLFFMSIPIMSGILFWLANYVPHKNPFLTFVSIYLLINNLVFYYFVRPNFKNKYHILYKKEILNKVNTYMHESIFSFSSKLEEEEIYHSELFPFITNFESKNLIKGHISHVPFKSSDITLNYYHNKEESWSFKGQWFIFQFSKPFKGSTHIYEKKDSIYPFNKQLILKSYLTDDPHFNQQFKIYTNNLDQTTSLLQHHFREGISLLERKYHNQLIIIFHKNYLFVGINNQSHRFNPSLLEKIRHIHFMNNIEDFLLIKNLIKYVKTIDKLSYTYITYTKTAIVS